MAEADYVEFSVAAETEEVYATEGDLEKRIAVLEKDMKAAAKALEFETSCKNARYASESLRQKLLQVGI